MYDTKEYIGKYAEFIQKNGATLVWLNPAPVFTPNVYISATGYRDEPIIDITLCVPFVDLVDSDALPSGIWMCSGDEDFTDLIHDYLENH